MHAQSVVAKNGCTRVSGVFGVGLLSSDDCSIIIVVWCLITISMCVVIIIRVEFVGGIVQHVQLCCGL